MLNQKHLIGLKRFVFPNCFKTQIWVWFGAIVWKQNTRAVDLRGGAVEGQLVRLGHDGVAVGLGHVGQGVPVQGPGLSADNL